MIDKAYLLKRKELLTIEVHRARQQTLQSQADFNLLEGALYEIEKLLKVIDLPETDNNVEELQRIA